MKLNRWAVRDRATGKFFGLSSDDALPKLFSSRAVARGYAGHGDRRFATENRKRFAVVPVVVTVEEREAKQE